MSEGHSKRKRCKKRRIAHVEPQLHINDEDEDLKGGMNQGNAHDVKCGDAQDPDGGDGEEFERNGRKKRKRKRPSSRRNVKKARKDKTFNWSGLPAELRNAIYEICLVRQSPIDLISTRVRRRSIYCQMKNSKQGLIPKILLINKSTFSEGRPLLYQNKFDFRDPWSMHLFMKSTSPSSKAYIERISLSSLYFDPGFWTSDASRVDVDFRVLALAFKALIGTTNLKELELDIWNVESRLYEWDGIIFLMWSLFARFVLNLAGPWFRAVGREAGDMEAGIRLISINDRTDPDWPDREAAIEEVHAEMRAHISRALSDLDQREAMAAGLKT